MNENGFTENNESHVGNVNIKVDTGMSRNGCQPSDLNDLVMVGTWDFFDCIKVIYKFNLL